MMLNTLDGLRGRGLGRLAQHSSLANDFSTAMSPLFAARVRVTEAAAQSAIPIADHARLLGEWDRLDRRRAALLTELEALQSQDQLAAWLTQSEALERDVDAYVAEVDAVIGYEQMNRPLKLGLLTVGATVALGGVVWAVWGYMQKKGPWRRRRKR
jgi:hypothetical protein